MVRSFPPKSVTEADSRWKHRQVLVESKINGVQILHWVGRQRSGSLMRGRRKKGEDGEDMEAVSNFIRVEVQ